MTGQCIPIILNLIAAFLGAVGQFFYQRGGQLLKTVPLWKNYNIQLGVLSFGLVMLLFVKAYQAGGRISVVYPFYATTFVWGYFIGVYVNREPASSLAVVGLGFMVAGISLIAYAMK